MVIIFQVYCWSFYSRTSCEVRRIEVGTMKNLNSFYSRTSCEVRLLSRFLYQRCRRFYSRTSCEVRLSRDLPVNFQCQVSTHAPHARCDANFYGSNPMWYSFYSRTSCEVRLNVPIRPYLNAQFLLTHLMRGATDNKLYKQSDYKFLLTHLMRGATH